MAPLNNVILLNLPGVVNMSKSSIPLVLKKFVNWFLTAEDESAMAKTLVPKG
jgi:hypothetical protein